MKNNCLCLWCWWCLISSKSFHLFPSLYQLNYILFHSDIYSNVWHLALKNTGSFSKPLYRLDYLHSEWWRGGIFFLPKWIHFISSWEIVEECVILLVEGCSLIQSAMKYNWITLSEFASYRHLLKYSTVSFYLSQISLIKPTSRQRGRTNHCLLRVKTCLVQDAKLDHILPCLFRDSQGWWQSSSCTTVL